MRLIGLEGSEGCELSEERLGLSVSYLSTSPKMHPRIFSPNRIIRAPTRPTILGHAGKQFFVRAIADNPSSNLID